MARGFFAGLIDRVVKKAAKAPPAPRRGPHEVDPNVPPGVRMSPKPVAKRQAMLLLRDTEPTGERTTIPVPQDQFLEPFLAGTKAFVTSSVIAAAEYNRERQELTFWFLPETSLIPTVYEGITEQDATDFFQSPSKGGFWHDRLLGPNWTPGGGTVKSWHFL